MSRRKSMEATAPAPRIIRMRQLAWEDLLPGVARKRIGMEPSPGRPSILCEMSMVRYAPGAEVPLHKHSAGDEIVYVIEGALSDEYGEITAGNVGYRPDGCTHRLRSPGGAITLSYLTGGAELVGEKPADCPPSSTIDVNAMVWRSVEGDRMMRKVIWQDRSSDRCVMLERFAAGLVAESPDPVGDQLVFPLEGTLTWNRRALACGDIGFRPRGCRLSVASEHGGVGLIYAWGCGDGREGRDATGLG